MLSKKLEISPEIRAAAPGLKVIAIEADVINQPSPEALVEELKALEQEIIATTPMEAINKRPGIAATRLAYKACGKEPNRYRPSSEALMRRIVKKQGLYFIDALVDLINLLSLRSGYSIGGFDCDRIEGDTVTLGIGNPEEPYAGIGRGMLNIEGMPVWRDSIGGIGTPTSDNERTKISLATSRLLMIINVYGEEMPIADTIAMAETLLEKHASATNIKVEVIG